MATGPGSLSGASGGGGLGQVAPGSAPFATKGRALTEVPTLWVRVDAFQGPVMYDGISYG
jgi:hypothetical protein